MGATGTLYVVATPIGNLEDITLRALRILRDVALIAAEDTRHTRKLLTHYQISTPLVSVHEHNEVRRHEMLLSRLKGGDSVALVTDAGTPGISDPGALTVRAARDAGVRVTPIPGASAVVTALSASGIAFDRFAFAGFAPIGLTDRKAWWEWVDLLSDRPVVCFEAPHRLVGLLREASVYLVDRPMFIGREMTKVHEEWLEGNAEDLASRFNAPRGEFVVTFAPVEITITVAPTADAAVLKCFGQVMEGGTTSRRAALQETARRLNIPVRAVYAALERGKPGSSA